MKLIKINKCIIGLLVLGLTIVSFVCIKTWNSKSEKILNSSTVASLDEIKQQLNIEHHEIKQKLARIGITDETCNQVRDVYYKQYRDQEKPPLPGKVSKKTEQFVKKVLTRCGIDPNTIRIVPFNDQSPAAAAESMILINEEIFKEHSEPAQFFVISHEAQHILQHDDPYFYLIDKHFGITPEELAAKNDYNHPLLHYSRFTEKRADIEAALQGLEWAEAYYVFAKEICTFNEDVCITHPKDSERLELAQSILKCMKTNQLQTA